MQSVNNVNSQIVGGGYVCFDARWGTKVVTGPSQPSSTILHKSVLKFFNLARGGGA